MAIPYQNVAKAVALRAGLIVGGDYAAREAAYAVANIAAELDGVEVPASALRQDILSIEAEIAEKIAYSSNSLLRRNLRSESAVLLYGSEFPLTDSNAKQFIGAFDAVIDDNTGTPLTEKSRTEVFRYIANPEDFLIRQYHFCIEGTLIFHTTEGVKLRGCIFDKAAAATAYDAQGNSILPQQLENYWIDKVLGRMNQENWFVAEATSYRQSAIDFENRHLQPDPRLLQMPQMPTTTARVDSAKD